MPGTPVLSLDRRSDPWWRHGLIGLGALLVAWPLAATITHYWGMPFFPVGDRALIEMHVRDVFSTRTPFVGPYSRYGWEHPGPLGYWVLSIPYHLLGAPSWGILLSSLAVNVASVALFLVTCLRRGGLALYLGAAAMSATLLENMGGPTLVDPWNPFVTVLPMLAFFGTAWSARESERWAIPVSVLLASYLVQSHVGYAVIVAAVTAWAVAPAVRRWRAGTRPPLVPTTGAGRTAAVIAAVVWLPVAFDLVFLSHNLWTLGRYFLTSEHPNPGFAYGGRIVGREIGLEGPWWRFPEPPAATGDVLAVEPVELGLTVAVLLLVAGALALTIRRARRAASTGTEIDPGLVAAGRLQVLALIVLVAGWISVARVSEIVWDYLIRWWWAAAAFIWLAAGMSVWHVVRHWRPAARVVGPVAVTALLFVTATHALDMARAAPTAPMPQNEFRGAMVTLSDKTSAAVPTDAPVFVRAAGGGDGTIADGIRLQLERSGHLVVVEPAFPLKFGRDRSVVDHPAGTTVWVVSGPEIPSWQARDDVTEVAAYDQLLPEEREEYIRRAAQLTAELDAAGRPDLAAVLNVGEGLPTAVGLAGVDQENLGRVEALRARGRPSAVFLEPFQMRHTT